MAQAALKAQKKIFRTNVSVKLRELASNDLLSQCVLSVPSPCFDTVTDQRFPSAGYNEGAR
jgi:hypothetical protein